MVQWFNGSMVQWFNGSMIQCLLNKLPCTKNSKPSNDKNNFNKKSFSLIVFLKQGSFYS